MNTVLDIKNIHKSFAISYGKGSRVFGTEYKNVIDGLTLSLEEGKITSLVGGNGAGKTTLFNLVSGLLRPDGGSIVLKEDSRSIDCTRATPWKIASAGLGRMFQGSRIFGELSVMDQLFIQVYNTNVETPFYRLLHPVKSKASRQEGMDRIVEGLREFDDFRSLLNDGAKPASSLSFARQRMLSLAGLLLGDYRILLLDEPTSGLSPESFGTLYHFLDIMREHGKTVFLIEHNMKFINKAVDHCHYMAAGKILYSGNPAEVLQHSDVKQSYLL
jgi:branched-chain amino acid transport system ATP-binding protein